MKMVTSNKYKMVYTEFFNGKMAINIREGVKGGDIEQFIIYMALAGYSVTMDKSNRQITVEPKKVKDCQWVFVPAA